MLIDWFTVAAQIFNFLLLVWLLKRFLYGRILGAVEARESKIAGQLAEAGAKEKEAGERLVLYEAKLKGIEQHQEAMLAQIRRDVAKTQADMLEAARERVHALERKWQEELERDRAAFLLEFRRRAATELVHIARRALTDLACLDVQECAIKVFLEKLRVLDRDTSETLAKGDLLIRTAFDVPAEARAQIQHIFEERLGRPVVLLFERAPAIGLGLELRADGLRIGWNSEDYLEGLEQDLRDALEHSPEPRTHAEAT